MATQAPPHPPARRRALAVLLKDADGADAYAAALAPLGVDTACVPVLAFESVGGAELAAALAAFDGAFSGMVLTSARAACELARALDTLNGGGSGGYAPLRVSAAVAAVTRAPLYALGRKTLAPLAGWWEPGSVVTTDGVAAPACADSLADAIVADWAARGWAARGAGDAAGASSAAAPSTQHHHHQRSPLLFLCGDKRLDALPARLAAAGIPLAERCVYRTVPAPPDVVWGRVLAAATAAVGAGRSCSDHGDRDLAAAAGSPPSSEAAAGGDSAAAAATAAVAAIFLVVFSPSGLSSLAGTAAARFALAEGALPVALPPVPLSLVALGATTAAAVRSGGLPLPAAAVAPSPDAAGVAAAVSALLAAPRAGARDGNAAL